MKNILYFNIFVIIFCLPPSLSAQMKLIPDSMVLQTLEGKKLNKQESEYNSNDREAYRLYSIWDRNSNKWRYLMEFSYEYDREGNIIEEQAFMMDSISEQWNGLYKYVSEFDRKGNEIKKRFYSWNQTNNDWTTNFMYKIEIDEKGNKTEEISYFGRENDWIKSSHKNFKYEYDEEGNCIRMKVFDLKSDIKSYTNPQYKYEYEYDDMGNLISNSYYLFLNEYQWIPKNRYEYEYDTEGNRILETHFIGDEDYGGWDEHYKYGHEYKNGMLVSMNFYYWDKKLSEWTGKYNYIYEYDEDGNPAIIKLHKWEQGGWFFNEIATYYYPEKQLQASGQTTPDANNIIIYPNPVSGSFAVSGAENSNLTIVDMQGRIIYTKKNIKEEEIIQTSGWPTGAYIVSLNINGKQISRKILVNPYP